MKSLLGLDDLAGSYRSIVIQHPPVGMEPLQVSVQPRLMASISNEAVSRSGGSINSEWSDP